MIPQTLMDWFRDLIVAMLDNMATLLAGMDAAAAAGGIAGGLSAAGKLLALFISPGVWGSLMTVFGIWLAVWGITGVIAIIGRRGASSGD